MAFSKEDISALRLLLREELSGVATKEELQDFRTEFNQSFDAIFQKIETLEQEYSIVKDQVKRLEPSVQ